MADHLGSSAFDVRIARLFDTYAEAGVGPLDSQAVARRIASGHRRSLADRLPRPGPIALRQLAIASVVAVLAATALLLGAGGTRPAPQPSSADVLLARSGHVYVVDALGTFEDLGEGRQPAWSRDETIVAFADGNGRLIALDRATGSRTDLGPAGSGDGAAFRPYEWITISGDGRWILLASANLESDHFILVDRSSGTRSQLRSSLWKDSGIPAWSPDGDRAVAPTLAGLVLIDATTSPPIERNLGRGGGGDVAFGPGDRIAYVSAQGISVIGADGGGQHALVSRDPSSFVSLPAWSPDGATIAFRMTSTVTSTGHVDHLDRIGLVDVASDSISYLPAEPYGTSIQGVGWAADDALRVELSPSSEPARTTVQWLTLGWSIRDQVDLGLGVEWVAPAAAEPTP